MIINSNPQRTFGDRKRIYVIMNKSMIWVGFIVFEALFACATVAYIVHKHHDTLIVERAIDEEQESDYFFVEPGSPFHQLPPECPPEYIREPIFFFYITPPAPYFVPGISINICAGWWYTPGYGCINVGVYTHHRHPFPHEAGEHHRIGHCEPAHHEPERRDPPRHEPEHKEPPHKEPDHKQPDHRRPDDHRRPPDHQPDHRPPQSPPHTPPSNPRPPSSPPSHPPSSPSHPHKK